MKLFTVAGVAASYAAAMSYHDLPAVDVSQFKELTFDNLVDHYNYLDDRTYSQRYWVSDEYTTDEGPIFVYICGEYMCSVPETRLYPFMVGAHYGAQFMVVEHRFYGHSQPFDDWSLDSLAYLSSEQAMSDLAYLIGSLNTSNKRVFVIGGSYPGALSAWFRERYPHLTVGAWSSSGVVNPITDFWKFDEQTWTSTAKSGVECSEAIQKGMKYATELGRQRDSGVNDTVIDATLSGSSEGMRTDDWMFYFADIFLESVQYGNRTAVCDMIADIDEDEQHWGDAFILGGANFGATVANVNPPDYDTRVWSETTVVPEASSRPWTFQYCTEYGWFQVPSQEHVMRSEYLQMDYWPEMCERMFQGMKMDERPKAKSTRFDQGALDMGGTNIFFANGTEDPWKWATKMDGNAELNQVARTSECDNCGHCVELYTPSDSDAKELQETRQQIFDWIDKIMSPAPSQAFLQ